jgi:hypothetical protein
MKRNKTNCISGFLTLAVLLLSSGILTAQYVVGGTVPDPSAVLDIQGTNGGLLLPRLSNEERNSITNPAWGLMIINTSTLCLEINLGTSGEPQWTGVQCRTGILATLSCGGTILTGSLFSGRIASGVSYSVPYAGGNGGIYSGQTISSTGITGLSATLLPGNFSDGDGSLTYTISGTPSGVGTASFDIQIGGQTCTVAFGVIEQVCRAKIDATTYK